MLFAGESFKLTTRERMKGMGDAKLLRFYSTNACSATPLPDTSGILHFWGCARIKILEVYSEKPKVLTWSGPPGLQRRLSSRRVPIARYKSRIRASNLLGLQVQLTKLPRSYTSALLRCYHRYRIVIGAT
jgi:hypothetical protein